MERVTEDAVEQRTRRSRFVRGAYLAQDFPTADLNGDGVPDNTTWGLNTEVNEILRAPELKASMIKLGFEPTTMSPPDFAAFVAADTRKWADIVKSTSVKVE